MDKKGAGKHGQKKAQENMEKKDKRKNMDKIRHKKKHGQNKTTKTMDKT